MTSERQHQSCSSTWATDIFDGVEGVSRAVEECESNSDLLYNAPKTVFR
jgi:hypothetical protein